MTPEELQDQRQIKAALYKRVFLVNPEGEQVLADLVRMFYDVQVFVQGGQDGDRATAYKAGQRAAIHHILQQIGQVGETNNG